MTMTRVTLERDFNTTNPVLFNLWIDGCPVNENEPLTASTVLALLGEHNIIDYHEVDMVHIEPEKEQDCPFCDESPCECGDDEYFGGLDETEVAMLGFQHYN